MATLPLLTSNTNDTYNALRSSCVSIQSTCLGVQASSTAGSVSYDQLLSLLTQAQRLSSLITTIAGNSSLVTALTTLIQTYAAMPALQVGSLATAMLNATNNLITAIATDYPKGAGNTVADRTMNASGAVTVLTTNSAGLTNTLSAITAWLATVS